MIQMNAHLINISPVNQHTVHCSMMSVSEHYQIQAT